MTSQEKILAEYGQQRKFFLNCWKVGLCSDYEHTQASVKAWGETVKSLEETGLDIMAAIAIVSDYDQIDYPLGEAIL